MKHMSLPPHLWRHPTRAAIDSLAARFGLPNEPDMQDWQWEVSHLRPIEDFLDAYLHAGLTDDEKFTLMETILDSFEHSTRTADDPIWQTIATQLDQNFELHLDTIFYWAKVQSVFEGWRISPWMREIWYRHGSDIPLVVDKDLSDDD